MKINYSFPKQITYLFWIYGINILVFFIFRLILLSLNISEITKIVSEEGGYLMLMKSLFMGFRFDSVIISYVLSSVVISFLIAYFCNINNRIFYKINHYFIIVLFSICFLISSVDIPYFQYFFNRFNIQALTWLDTPLFVLKMVFEEVSYIIFFFLFIGVISLYSLILWRVYKKWLRPQINSTKTQPHLNSYILNSIVFILLIGLCFLGMRGRIEKKSPIKIGTAYFSNNPLINQIGLNPVFTFIKSIEEKTKSSNKELNLIDKTFAKNFVISEFNYMISHPTKLTEPILDNKTNVILVIMESMGTCNIGYFGSEKALTPNLDSLLIAGISYENVYTAGIHTYNGIYSSLFGLPALMDRHSMNHTIIPKIEEGLPNVLKANGYNTLYFTTHDSQFDNVGGFLSANSMERIISGKDYPKKEIKSTLGVPDHTMFYRAIEELNKMDTKNPFFATILTASNHAPYIFPEAIGLIAKSKDIKDKMIEYSDWAIGQFINKAKNCHWFKNTLFIFVADHGSFKGHSDYEMPLSYHHTPLIFYMPSKLHPTKIEEIGLQIDIPALVYSYLGIENKNVLSIDFDIHPRRYGYFCADDKVGVIDNEYFYIWNRNGTEYLYKYKSKDKTNYIKVYPQKAKDMQRYAFSMMMFRSEE